MEELRKMLKEACIEAFELKPISKEVRDTIHLGHCINYWDNFNHTLYNKIKTAKQNGR